MDTFIKSQFIYCPFVCTVPFIPSFEALQVKDGSASIHK